MDDRRRSAARLNEPVRANFRQARRGYRNKMWFDARGLDFSGRELGGARRSNSAQGCPASREADPPGSAGPPVASSVCALGAGLRAARLC